MPSTPEARATREGVGPMSGASPAGRGWETLGGVEFADLTDARLQLHWAAQLVASVGATYIAPRLDDSHPNMEFVNASGLLAGHATETDRAVRAALDPAALTLIVLDETSAPVDRLPLDGVPLDRAYDWLTATVTGALPASPSATLARDLYDIPPHAVGGGRPFALGTGEAFAEIGRWFANADLVLRRAVAGEPFASPVRCWPHHFDIGTVVPLDPDAGPEVARSIGLGMTPGDDSYAEPYFYVNPWPRPASPPSAPLPGGGHWHAEGWIGAVLPATDIVRAASAAAQESATVAYIRSAIDANRRMLGCGRDGS